MLRATSAFLPQKRILLMRLFLIVFLSVFGNLASGQIVNIEEQRIFGTNDSTHWYGSLKAAFNYAKVQQTSLQWHAESNVQYKNGRHLSLMLLNYDLLKAGDNDFINNAFAHLRYNYKLTGPLVWEAYTQLQTNKLLFIRTRFLAGTGLRRRFFLTSDERSRLYFGASWMWEQNDFIGEQGFRSWHRASTYVSVSLRFKNNMTLIGTQYWQPVIGFIKNYRALTDWTLALPLSKRLSFVVDFTFTREIGLPSEAPSETVSWKNGVTWRF